MAFTPQGMSPSQLLSREPYDRRSGERSGERPRIDGGRPAHPALRGQASATWPVRSTDVDRRAHDAVTSVPLNGARTAGLD